MFKIKIEIEVPQRVVEDILVTAFEGGINYWCYKVTGHKVGFASDWLTKGDGTPLNLHTEEGVKTLHISHLLDGLSKAIAQGMCEADLNEDWHVDAEQADCIMQLAVFDEIMYG
jgi:hypothetical protein